MMKITRPVPLFLLILILTAGYSIGVSLLYKRLSLNYKSAAKKLDVSQDVLKRQEEETKRLTSEAEAIRQENEQMKTDALSYLKQQKSLQDTVVTTQKELSSSRELIKRLEDEKKILESELAALKKNEEQLVLEMSAAEIARKEAQEAAAREVKSKLSQLEQTLGQERAIYHYNLAVAYSNAKQYDNAINEYEEVLKLNPDDANSHYNLGILYDEYRKDKQKAIERYQSYLELSSDAEDIDDVRSWIERLGGT